MRNIAKKGMKRVGRAFGASEIIDSLDTINNKMERLGRDMVSVNNELKDQMGVLRNNLEISLPFIRFNYYNEVAKLIHPCVFEKYKDCNKNKTAVLVACGPSVDRYKPIKNAFHVGVNRAFLKSDIKFNVLMMHDNIMAEEHTVELKDYKAEKLVAFATNTYNAENFNMSTEQVAKIGGKRFLISDCWIPDYGGGKFDVINPDISKGVLFDRGGGTVFSALQFILYTNPKKLYLVGCDCNDNGYFNAANKRSKQRNYLKEINQLWQEAKVFIDEYYPELEVISLNPVGLKGLFKDVKTED